MFYIAVLIYILVHLQKATLRRQVFKNYVLII